MVVQGSGLHWSQHDYSNSLIRVDPLNDCSMTERSRAHLHLICLGIKTNLCHPRELDSVCDEVCRVIWRTAVVNGRCFHLVQESQTVHNTCGDGLLE